MGRIYNFSAGPSVLPEKVLTRAASEMLDYGGSGMSVMEMSHRSKVYDKIFQDTKEKLRSCLSVPEKYEILFLQGGASLQFSMVPMNLMGGGCADYAVTGNFSELAYKEGAKLGDAAVAVSTADCNHTRIPDQSEISVRPDARFFHYCANNTVYGTEWSYVPDAGNAPLVCDMSSNILSKPIDVSRYGIIYAGAQKNMAPAGLTVVLIDKELQLSPMSPLPTMLSYKTMMEKDSMYNTPPCYNVYILGLVLDWLAETGGLAQMEKFNREKARLLYGCLENSPLFEICAEKDARSNMNVTFRTSGEELDAKFVAGASVQGMSNLKGHRKVGGMRASIYNAMPIEGVKALCAYIERFQKENA